MSTNVPEPTEAPLVVEQPPPTDDATGTESTDMPETQGGSGDPFALTQLVREYVIPVETNNIWYALGGVLAIALVLEVLTGLILTLKYIPDANSAYDITKGLMQSSTWSIIVNFHFWNAILIFGLVMIHMLRVFLSGGYRGGKVGLWQVGVGLAGFTFIVSLTGEALHWDEIGFGVTWNIGEFLDAIGLAGAFNYTTDALKSIPTATEKLVQLYVVHISLVPILLILLIGMHYYLIRVKGISMPFWLRASGRKAPFSEHIRVWIVYSLVAIAIVLLVSIFVPRDAGTSPQLLPSSPLYSSDDDPGGLGFKPNFPISWTRGMNIVVANLGLDPDIWGTVLGMVLMLAALVVIPFVDRAKSAPQGWAAAFDMRKRGWAFLAMGIFWGILILGLVASTITEAG